MADSMNNTNSIAIENVTETDESLPRNYTQGHERSSVPLIPHQTINQVQY